MAIRPVLMLALAVGSSLLLSGCWYVRLPTLYTGHPVAERRAYELHDPFPEREPGPDTFVRPRGFEEQRRQPRRSAEQAGLIWTLRQRGRQMNGITAPTLMPVVPPPPPPGAPPAGPVLVPQGQAPSPLQYSQVLRD